MSRSYWREMSFNTVECNETIHDIHKIKDKYLNYEILSYHWFRLESGECCAVCFMYFHIYAQHSNMSDLYSFYAIIQIQFCLVSHQEGGAHYRICNIAYCTCLYSANPFHTIRTSLLLRLCVPIVLCGVLKAFITSIECAHTELFVGRKENENTANWPSILSKQNLPIAFLWLNSAARCLFHTYIDKYATANMAYWASIDTARMGHVWEGSPHISAHVLRWICVSAHRDTFAHGCVANTSITLNVWWNSRDWPCCGLQLSNSIYI